MPGFHFGLVCNAIDRLCLSGSLCCALFYTLARRFAMCSNLCFESEFSGSEIGIVDITPSTLYPTESKVV